MLNRSKRSYAEWLDYQNIKWIYEYKIFMLSSKKKIIPDFYLPEMDEYKEVKGRWYQGGKEKFELFQKDYPEIQITLVWPEEIKRIRKQLEK